MAGLMLWGCYSTPPPEPATAEEMLIRQVTPMPGFTKAQLYEGVKLWVGTYFSDALDVIQHSDRNQGIVMGKTYVSHRRPAKWDWEDEFYECRFTLIAETKDERIRTTFKDLYLINGGGTTPILKSDMEVIRPKLEAAVKSLAASFTQTKPRDDNW
jgi:hypothetical protein